MGDAPSIRNEDGRMPEMCSDADSGETAPEPHGIGYENVPARIPPHRFLLFQFRTSDMS